MRQKPYALALLFILVTRPLLAGDGGPPNDADFSQERYALQQELNALRETYRDASPDVRLDAIEAWRQENHERLENVRDGMVAGNEDRKKSPELLADRIARLEEMETPDGLSEAERQYFEKRRSLEIDRLERLQALGESTAFERREHLLVWREEAADEIAALRELLQEIQEPAGRSALPFNEDLLPQDLSEEERTFIRKRHELHRERAAFRAAYADASPEEYRHALTAWQEERRERIEELRALAEEFSH